MLVREEAPFNPVGVTIDRSGKYPVARGVLLCGRTSERGWDYDDEAFSDLNVYEGQPGYLDHHKGEGNRSYANRICWYEKPRRNSQGLPIADQGFNPKHPMTEAVLWEIENKPENVRLSHVADVDKVSGADGRQKIVKINKVHSVDIVTRGATTKSICEDAPVPLTIKQYAKKIGQFLELPQQIKLSVLVKEEGMAEAPMMGDAPGMEGEMKEEDAGDGLDSAFKSACLNEIEECIAGASEKAKVIKCMKRLKKILMAHGELSSDEMEAEEDPEEETETTTETKTEESAPVKKKKKTTITEEAPEIKKGRCMQECVEEGFSFTAADMPVLGGIAMIDSKEDRLKAIRKMKGDRAAEKPKGGGRITEKVEEEAPVTVGPTTLTTAGAAYLEQVKKWNQEFWGSGQGARK
jgi:hypothetical protein